MDIKHYMNEVGQRARKASRAMAKADTAAKNHALSLIAAAIRRDADALRAANRLDLDAARANGLADAMLDRLSDAFQQQRNFVQVVSHELRTPLAALRGNIDVMLMETQPDRQTAETLQRMSAELDRLIRLASNLLYMAHADAGRPIDVRPVELDALCLEVVHQTNHLRPGTKIRLDEVDQVSVSGDRDLLKQMLLNLADNALKYTSEGSEVAVRLRQHDEWASIEVTDSGPGIPAEELPRIFERQYRGSNRNGRSGSGAGIGLAISQWIARVHGGRIDVASIVGTGSTFTVFLPIIRAGLLPSRFTEVAT